MILAMGLIIPFSHALHDKPPAFACTLCEAVFTEDERVQYERHVMGHPLEDVQAHSPKHTAPGLFDNYHPDYNDVDWQRWIDEHKVKDPHGWRRWMRTDAGKNSSGVGDG